jgi:hypothetical protein
LRGKSGAKNIFDITVGKGYDSKEKNIGYI